MTNAHDFEHFFVIKFVNENSHHFHFVIEKIIMSRQIIKYFCELNAQY